MATVTQNGVTFSIDANKNMVTEEIVVEKITAVPNVTTPEVQRIISVVGGNQNESLGLFSNRQEVTLTGQYMYLGNITFKKSNFEDDVTEFTAKVEFLIECETANSQCLLKLYDFNSKADITGSLVDSGVKAIGKYNLFSTTLTMPTESIIECWGKKSSGNVTFLNASIVISKKRKTV